ncbi:fibronectin type III domain-containing protein [Verrucomicrobiales bacterium]|nr:fibronectin type III domain-containing protein [Verrucomicrobiales bacterium]
MFRIFSPLFLAPLLACLVGILSAEEAPGGYGQLENAPQPVPGGIDEEGRDYSYLGQLETEGKLILTASNGFFTKGTCQAKGESKLPKVGDEDLIVPNYEHLDWKSNEGTLRWHLLVKRAGMVRFNVHLASGGGAGDVEVKFAGASKVVKPSSSNAKKAQAWDLAFEVEEPGEYMISLGGTGSSSGGSIGQLYHIDAFGPAIEEAQLLRVRWRPAAAHGGYDTSKVPNSKLLVFTTRSIAPISSYSPITTPFGYYGTSFDGDMRSNGSFNFSMWGKDGAASDLKMMPHLLGVGSPEGEFSGFGHEGSGVKPRGWDPMPDRPELVVQALRLVPGKDYDAYYGYYFDHPTNAWKFYGGGKKWHGGKSNEHLKLGSFCEVPGPPQVERTGDVYREVRRRGWSYDDGKWVPLETYSPGGSGSSGDEPVNKSWYTTKDGEYAMGCGGIRLYSHKDALVKPGGIDEPPYFLTSASLENVFQMPIEYRAIQASEVGSDRARIEMDVASLSNLQSGIVFYGVKDALTFAPRELHGTEKNSSLSNEVNSQSWEEKVELPSAELGLNAIELTGLEPDTTYFYRVLMKDEVSQVWNEDTLSFRTTSSGSAPVKMEPLIASEKSQAKPKGTSSAKRLEEELVRVWTYSAGGTSAPSKLEGRLVAIAANKVQIERKSDGKKGTLDVSKLSDEDRAYIDSKR